VFLSSFFFLPRSFLSVIRGTSCRFLLQQHFGFFLQAGDSSDHRLRPLDGLLGLLARRAREIAKELRQPDPVTLEDGADGLSARLGQVANQPSRGAGELFGLVFVTVDALDKVENRRDKLVEGRGFF